MLTARRLGHALALALCPALALACAETKPPPPNVGGVAQVAPAAPPPPDVPVAPKTSDVYLSDEIRSKCGIPDEDAYFAFNSASITAGTRTPLDLVVKCFTSGPLQGRAMRLVGRADPRGPSEYNMTLGLWRADAVEGYLTSRGLSKSKAATSSRGSIDATGSDETTWQHDRRVDILLAE